MRKTFHSIIVLALAGCGFHPLYGPARPGHQAASAELAKIQVALIPDRAGQLLRQDLQQRFEGAGTAAAKRYVLQTSFAVAQEGVAILPDNSSSRARYTATATYNLHDGSADGPIIATGVARMLDAANVINNQYFAADLEGETITARMADGIADQITLRLSAYFDTHPVKPGS